MYENTLPLLAKNSFAGNRISMQNKVKGCDFVQSLTRDESSTLHHIILQTTGVQVTQLVIGFLCIYFHINFVAPLPFLAPFQFFGRPYFCNFFSRRPMQLHSLHMVQTGPA